MPERPKRRKNKNKRKNNKNNRSDVNQNNIEANETISAESCSNIAEDDHKPVEIKEEIKLEDKCETSSKDSILEPKISQIEKINDTEETINEGCNVSPSYIVETPEQVSKIKHKLDNAIKSKSCDNEDTPTIVEITDDVSINNDNKNSISIIDSNNVIITEDESPIKWENVDDFKLPQAVLVDGVLSSITIPLNVAHCEQAKTLSPEEEKSLRNYLQTLNLSTSSANVGEINNEIEQIINREVKYRLRRKGFDEENNYPRPGPSRSLAVIDEESSESSKTSRRQSYLSDKKSDNEELEDEVFESKLAQIERNGSSAIINKTASKHLIPQKCIRVDTRLMEPEISEARGDWTVQTVEKINGAELVYLTDSSSSTSSVYEVNEDISPGEDTDVSVRMVTPTIEITDTETLLSNTFFSKNDLESESKKNNIKISEKENENELSNKSDSYGNKEQNCLLIDSSMSSDNSHEIVILSTDNLKTNLFVKDLEEEIVTSYHDTDHTMNVHSTIKPASKPPNEVDEYDLEIKVLKCELNDAINNLIKEVTSDSEISSESIKDSFKRQDSSSSVDSSQCTAKYNPTHSSLNDVSNLILESDNNIKEIVENNSSIGHVKEVIKSITTEVPLNDNNVNNTDDHPFSLRDICLKKITTLPFGDKILEELANVSQRLQNSVLASKFNNTQKQDIDIKGKVVPTLKENNQVPPPIYPRKSSLRKPQDEQCKSILNTHAEPVYECLSPSQKMLMEKTNTVISKEDIAKKGDTHSSKVGHKSNIQRKLDMTHMKSETGSRLLALLRDTSNSTKLNSSSPNNRTRNELNNIKFAKESSSNRLLDEIDSSVTPFYDSNSRFFSSQYSKPLITPKPEHVSRYCYDSDYGKENSFSNLSKPNRRDATTYFYESDSGIRENSLPDLPLRKKNNICSYSYESDSGIRENSYYTLRDTKKYFHYSTGNLSKEIESDISSIQNMHRYCTNLRDNKNEEIIPRRPSLPKDLCEQQMEYIRQKEKEVDAEICRLENEKNIHRRGPRAPMVSDSVQVDSRILNSSKIHLREKSNVPIYPTISNVEKRNISSLFSSSEEELLREKMYSEYVNQMAEREQRKQNKVIKVTQTPIHKNATSKSMSALESLNSKINNRIEQEFISKAKARWSKLGIHDPEPEEENKYGNNIYREPKVIEHKIKVIESGEEKDVKKLPSHIQDFVKFTVNDKDDENGSTGESEKTSAHVVVFCAVVILVLTVGKFLIRLFRNQ